jgi:predicted lipoprotein with Yx(FWY)xxD motif
MKRIHGFLAVAFLSAAGATTVAGAESTAPTAHASGAAVIGVHHSSLGTILVSSSGRTLYEFTRDHAGKNSCAPISGCSEAWPPLKTSGKPIAHSGVKASLLSSINLPGGGKQVTYGGHPLYLYAGDSGAAETSYVGVRQFGGNWYAINGSAHAVK